jgi:hypothetical protein
MTEKLFSASSLRRDLNMSATNITSKCRIARIELDDAMILAHVANPRWIKFSEGTRFSEKPARWILQHLEKREGVDVRLLDLRDFPMPFFDEPATPATPGRPPYKNEVVQR